MDSVKEHNGRPCRVEEMQIGETLFTVISVQGDHARETADEKVKKLILNSTQIPVGNEPHFSTGNRKN